MDQARFKAAVKKLSELPENAECADCAAKHPRWASANLGVFMCIRCSGIHRSMGVHISFVRSVTMDSWKEPQVRTMARWGNRKANQYFEASVPKDYYIPSEHDDVSVVERWIRDKYEHRRFASRKSTDEFLASYVDSGGKKSKKSKKEKKEKKEKKSKKDKPEAAAAAAAAPAAPAGIASRAAAPAADDDLDFFDPPAAAAAAPAARAAPAPAVATADDEDDDFLGFDVHPTAPSTPSMAGGSTSPAAPSAAKPAPGLTAARSFGSAADDVDFFAAGSPAPAQQAGGGVGGLTASMGGLSGLGGPSGQDKKAAIMAAYAASRPAGPGGMQSRGMGGYGAGAPMGGGFA